jgi:hypothetical protein
MLREADNKGIVWLASYPKSGNTWLRVFLTHVLNPNHNTSAAQQLPLVGTGASARFLLDRVLGFDSKLLHEDHLALLRPTIYDWYGQQPGIQYFKIHDAYCSEKINNPIISNASNLGVIYIVRNPLDVAISFAHHMNCSIDDAIQQMNCPVLALKGSATRPLSQARQICSSWSLHVKSWIEANDLRRLTIRYEDMHADPLATFSKALNFLQCEMSEELMLQAIEKSRFATLKKDEQAFGFKESAGPDRAFFRKGIVGDWANTLKDRQVEQIIEQHGEVMRRFNYLNDQNQPVME